MDEIEKAHPDVSQLLLQILEDGSLTDAKGRKVDFSNAIIILTSNLGAETMQKEASLGFKAKTKSDEKKLASQHEENETIARDALRRIMKPELINRFDGIIVFHALTRQQVGKIFDIQVDDLQNRLMKKGLRVGVMPSAKRWLIDKGYDEYNGARPLRRALQDHLEHAIADGLLSGEFKKGSVLQAKLKKDELVVSTKAE